MIPASWEMDLLEFVDRRKAQWSKQLVGATVAQIAELQRECGRRLPQSYNGFLRTMGLKDGGLAIAYAGTTSVDKLIDCYRQMREQNELSFVPDNCILIGTGDVSAGDVCLRLDGFNEPAVFLSIDGEIEQRYADSLPQLLFRKAFSLFEFSKQPCFWSYRVSDWAEYRAEESALDSEFGFREAFHERARAEFLRLGFESPWFSDSVTCYYISQDGIVMIESWDRFPLVLKVTGYNRDALERLGSLVNSSFHLQFEREFTFPR